MKVGKGAEFEGIISSLWRRYKEKDGKKDQDSELFHEECCPDCLGARLNEEIRQVTVAGKAISEVSMCSLHELLQWMNQLKKETPKAGLYLLESIKDDLMTRLKRIIDVGLGYLSIDRQMITLSGDEAQRLRLATLLGSGLTGVLYILDEPTTGLYPRDTEGLIAILKELRDLGNTVLVIEHDVEMMKAADYIIDIGQGAGNLQELMASKTSIKGEYFRHEKETKSHFVPRNGNGHQLIIKQASLRNLAIDSVSFPLGTLTSVTGVSDSGKSTLVVDILAKGWSESLQHDGISGNCWNGRFTNEVLSVKYKNYSISDLLDLSIEESSPILKEEPKVAKLIDLLYEIGLGYLTWGQSVKTLSGGEGQRIRLAKELIKASKKHMLYLLDEPTTELHPTDITRLMKLLNRLVDENNTI